MGKKLLIVGFGGHGRNCLDIARSLNYYDEISFMDDNMMVRIANDAKVVGAICQIADFYPEYSDIFIAITDNIYRNKLIKKAKRIGYNVISLVSERSYISPYATVGIGTVIYPNAVIEANADVGDGCIIGSNVTVGPAVMIDDACMIDSNTVVCRNAHICTLTKVGANCTVPFAKVIYAEDDIPHGSVFDID